MCINPQETLNNVLRHSKSFHRRGFGLSGDPERTAPRMEDRGVGMPDAGSVGSGLIAMRSAPRLLQGTCAASSAGGRTLVILEVPLAHAAALEGVS